MYFGYLVQAIDDFDCKLAVRRVGDVFFLYRRVNVNRIFQRRLTMQISTHLENAINTVKSNALAKMHQLRAMARVSAGILACRKKLGSRGCASTAIPPLHRSNSPAA